MGCFDRLFEKYDKLFLFDTETTGLIYNRDEIIEFAAVVLERRNDPSQENMVPYQKWADARLEADRLKVEVDLLKMALEDARNGVEASIDL